MVYVRWPDSAKLKSKFKYDESKSQTVNLKIRNDESKRCIISKGLISIRRFDFGFVVWLLDSSFLGREGGRGEGGRGEGGIIYLLIIYLHAFMKSLWLLEAINMFSS